jgi:preprotein translocase subunit SecB
MTEKFKILTSFIKDMSSETPNVETFLYVQKNINKYQLYIDITSKALKNKMIEVNTSLKFEDKKPNEKKSYYEIVYSTIVSVSDEIKDNKEEMQKMVLCDIPTAIYPKLEKAFLNLIHDSGHPNITFDKKIDFNKLYSEKFN